MNSHLSHRNVPITIIGGGIHGVSIAIRLLRDVPAAAKSLAIVDRHLLPSPNGGVKQNAKA